MALQKQPVNISFTKGLDTKTDPYQVAVGSFLSLVNSVFDTGGRLTKRNGFGLLSTLPNTTQTTLTTLNGNLVATGSSLYAYNSETDSWFSKGSVQPAQLGTLPLIRGSTSQRSPDSAIASNGLICLAYIDTSLAYYQISDSTTGIQIVSRTALPATAVAPRVFVLGQFFIVTFLDTVAATTTLQYIAIPISNPTVPRAVASLASNVHALTSGYDGAVAGNLLIMGFEGTGTTVQILYLTEGFGISPSTSLAATSADRLSLSVDSANSRIFMSVWDAGSTNITMTAFSYSLVQVMAATTVATGVTISILTSIATNRVATLFYQNTNTYTYDAAIRTDYVSTNTVTLPGSGTGVGTAGTPAIVLRSVGLRSKPILLNGSIYFLVVYGTTQASSVNNSNESTYFLVDSAGNTYMRLAATNAGGYASTQVVPSINILGSGYAVPYLVNDFLASVNKGTNLPSGTPTNAIYTQTGINLASFNLQTAQQYSSEIAGSLHLTGGILYQYDGVKSVEHGFHVFPENIAITQVGSGGSITAQVYFYVFTYEWTDNAGNLHRSAPSIPTKITVSAGSTTNTCKVPTLRLTGKISPNPVRIVGYRWSAAQPVYYQFTSLTSPTANDTTVDYVTITDTNADSAILGNTLLYTTGGVIENIAAPAAKASALYKNRLILIDAEDPNLLWYSKQVIQSTPVEMSDLLTLYVAPTSGAQGSTGPMTAISAMDDKLVIFKRDAIYYITGNGPDNTGANNDFSDPVFITSSVGCSNPNSVVLTPQGLMFQSDKGIWLLSRNLETQYVGAPVEEFNGQTVVSAQTIPGTNQIRFVLNNSVILMFDYFYQQWGTFTSVEAISSTLYQNVHTYLNSYGEVLKETPGTYLDGTSPVTMSFTTSWLNLAGLQGYERFYFMYLLGTYISPFRLQVQLAYDYNSSPSQSTIVTPDNDATAWGGEALYGDGGPWGGTGNVFRARVFPKVMKCESFQITVNELLGANPAGEGLTLSGINLIVGMKSGYRRSSKASRSFG